MELLLIGASTLILSVCTVLNKFYTNTTLGIKNANAIFLILSHPIAIILFFILAKGNVPINLTTLIYVVIYAIICLSTVLFTLISFNKTNLIAISVFTGAGGVILPFIIESIFSISTFSIYQIFSVVFRLIAVCLPFIFIKSRKKGLIYCIILFFISGAAVLLVKFYNITANTVSDNSFCFWTNVFILPASIVLLLFSSKPKEIIKDAKNIRLSSYLILIGVTLLNNLCTLMTLIAMNYVSATIFSVLQSAGAFILTSIASVTIFKEKLTKTEFFSLTFSIISVVFGLL